MYLHSLSVLWSTLNGVRSVSVEDLEAHRAALQTEVDTIERDIAELEARRKTTQSELSDVSVAVNVLRRMINPQDQESAPTMSEVQADPGTEQGRAFVEGFLADSARAGQILPTGRIRSTEMVGELVAEVGRPISRQEIRSRFEERYGIPPIWNNPINALNNAIGRAVEKRLIRDIGDGVFVAVTE